MISYGRPKVCRLLEQIHARIAVAVEGWRGAAEAKIIKEQTRAWLR